MVQPVPTGPPINLDTKQPINRGAQRVSRAYLNRLLNAHGIPHDHSGTRSELLMVCQQHGITSMPAPPPQNFEDQIAQGIQMPPVVQPPPENLDDKYPRNVMTLKKMAKERGIKVTRNDKRADLIEKLECQQDH